MSHRTLRKGLVGVAAGLCVVAAVLLWRCGGKEGPSTTAGPPAPSAKRPSWRGDRLEQRGQEKEAQGDPGESAAPDHSPTDEELLAAATVISIAPDRPEGAPPDPELPPAALSPELESKRRLAVEQWKVQAKSMLSRCARGDDRKQVELRVMLRPSPRAAGAVQQTVRAEAVMASPEVLRSLAYKHDPFALQACFQAVRGLAFDVPLSGEALAHAFPSSIESVAVAL